MDLASTSTGRPQQSEPTYGEQQVRIDVNPTGLPKVKRIKEKAANLINELMDQHEATGEGEIKAQYKLAIRSVQQACFWGVNAAEAEHELN